MRSLRVGILGSLALRDTSAPPIAAGTTGSEFLWAEAARHHLSTGKRRARRRGSFARPSRSEIRSVSIVGPFAFPLFPGLFRATRPARSNAQGKPFFSQKIQPVAHLLEFFRTSAQCCS